MYIGNTCTETTYNRNGWGKYMTKQCTIHMLFTCTDNEKKTYNTTIIASETYFVYIYIRINFLLKSKSKSQ